MTTGLLGRPGTVFVRFCEDNGLIGDPFLAGPTTARLTLAEERTEEFYRRNPDKTARDWLLAAFGEIAAVPVGAGLFDERHNALFQIPLSHDAAKDLIIFWRRRTEAGTLFHHADLAGAPGAALDGELTNALTSDTPLVAVVINTVDDTLDKGRQRDDGDSRDGEVALTGPRVLAPGRRIVALWDPALHYLGRKGGYHGGASPAEVTVPVLAFLPFRLSAASTSRTLPPGWRPLPDQRPRWWSLETTDLLDGLGGGDTVLVGQRTQFGLTA